MIKYLMIIILLFGTVGCNQEKFNESLRDKQKFELAMKDKKNKQQKDVAMKLAAIKAENDQETLEKKLAWQIVENEAEGKRIQKRLAEMNRTAEVQQEETNRTREVQQKEQNAFRSPLIQVLTLLWIAGFAYIYLGKMEIEGEVHKVRYKAEEETKRFKAKAVKDTFDKHWVNLSQNERKTLLGSLEKLALTYRKKKEDNDDQEKLG